MFLDLRTYKQEPDKSANILLLTSGFNMVNMVNMVHLGLIDPK